jgi:hypothetical protein
LSHLRSSTTPQRPYLKNSAPRRRGREKKRQRRKKREKREKKRKIPAIPLIYEHMVDRSSTNQEKQPEPHQKKAQ